MGAEEEIASLRAVVFGMQARIDALESESEGNTALGPEDEREIPQPQWTGLVFLNGRLWYDTDLHAGPTGAPIVDNSTNPGATAKAYIKVDVGNNAVTYEDGPPPYVSDGTLPDGEEWYETILHTDPIHITRF